MIIRLQHVIPIPLKEKLQHRQSDVWNNALVFNTGEWVKIKAPSGSGKTTFIHILWQLRTDYLGKVFYNDISADAINPNAMAALRQSELSIVFQDLRLFTNLTARENIELKRVMTEKPLYEPEKIDAMAEALGILNILDQQAGTCSYGEQQRIAIIRALMQPFQWLIMDEPFSHLDNANIKKASTLIAQECKSRGAGIIITDLEADDYFDYSSRLQL